MESRAQTLKEKLALIAEHQDEEDEEDDGMGEEDDDTVVGEMTEDQRECSKIFDGLVFSSTARCRET